MAKLYRGVCRELDEINEGALRPNGRKNTIELQRDGALQGMRRNGQFSRGNTAANAVRAHHLESGFGYGRFLSFSKSREKAIQFATQDSNGDRTDGYIYEVDEDLFTENGIIAHELENIEHPDEQEVTLRASNCGDLPKAIITSKTFVSSND